MAPRFLLDTNTISYIGRRRPPEVMASFRRLPTGEAAISVVTYGELIFGAEKKAVRTKALRVLDEISQLMPVLPLPPEAALIYGRIRAALEARGETISANDSWIAAHAQALDMTLVTNNEREFRRIDGLKIENWVAEPPA
jgi:tRNA(fMet)-specific endonuclease VapC